MRASLCAVAGDGLGRAEPGAQAAVEAVEGAAAIGGGLRGAPQRVRAEGEPGREVLLGWEAARVEADLGEDRLDGEGIEAVDASEVDARDAVEVRAQVDAGRVAPGCSVPVLRRSQRLFHTPVVRDGMLLRMVPWNVRPREVVRGSDQPRPPSVSGRPLAPTVPKD
jgi:hypothetical protein